MDERQPIWKIPIGQFNRVNIGRNARSVKEHGPNALLLADLNTIDFQPGSKEAFAFWADLKPEAYAITAVLCDAIVHDALDDKDSRSYGAFTYLYELRAEISGLLSASMGKILHQELEGDEEYKQVIIKTRERYAHIRHFLQQYISGGQSMLRIEAGIGTATRRMAETLEYIIKVYEYNAYVDSLGIEEFLQIAKNSYPLIAEIANMHIATFSLCDNTPYVYSLDLHNNEWKLILTDRARPSVGDYAVELETEPRIQYEHTAVGCPALIRFDGESAIQKLWFFHIDAAKAMHEQHHAGLPANRLIHDYKPMR